MENLSEIVKFLSENWAVIIASVAGVITSGIGLASIYVRFTPTPDDDTKLAKFKDWVSKYIALNPKV